MSVLCFAVSELEGHLLRAEVFNALKNLVLGDVR